MCLQRLAHVRGQRGAPGQLRQLVAQPLAEKRCRHLGRTLAAAQLATPGRAEKSWRPRVGPGKNTQHRRRPPRGQRRDKHRHRVRYQRHRGRRPKAVDVHKRVGVDPRDI